MPTPDSRSRSPFVEDLQARGRYCFTRAEALRSLNRSQVAVEAMLRRLKHRGRIASPRRGFYVIVPTEYRDAGCPPASWFIDDLMRFLAQPYYVGLLSAAAIHGAAHQQPMVFQVVTDRPTRPARAGRVHIAFHMSTRMSVARTTAVQTETGSMRVSTPESTAFDLVRFPRAAGHASNIATVLSELAERMQPRALAQLADAYGTPEIQRLGYLLEVAGQRHLAEPLEKGLQGRRVRRVVLAPHGSKRSGPVDARWRLVRNVEVEVDL